MAHNDTWTTLDNTDMCEHTQKTSTQLHAQTHAPKHTHPRKAITAHRVWAEPQQWPPPWGDTHLWATPATPNAALHQPRHTAHQIASLTACCCHGNSIFQKSPVCVSYNKWSHGYRDETYPPDYKRTRSHTRWWCWKNVICCFAVNTHVYV